MKQCLCILLIYTCSYSATAAEWLFGTSLNGEAREFYGSVNMHRDFITSANRDKKYWKRKTASIEHDIIKTLRKLQESQDDAQKKNLQAELYKLKNNRARCQIILGRYNEAYEELLKLEKLYPGESIIAENLATCEEMRGNFRNAIHWIKAARQRNALSAYSSLWAYEQLLIARHKHSANPAYLLEERVSGLQYLYENTRLQEIDLTLEENIYLPSTLNGKAKQIRKQLKTRLQLYTEEAKDPVLACLIAELAELYALQSVCETALPLFHLALDIGHPDEELINSHISKLKTVIAANPDSKTPSRSFWKTMQNTSWSNYLGVFGIFILILVAKQKMSKKNGGVS